MKLPAVIVPPVKFSVPICDPAGLPIVSVPVAFNVALLSTVTVADPSAAMFKFPEIFQVEFCLGIEAPGEGMEPGEGGEQLHKKDVEGMVLLDMDFFV